LLAVAFVSDFLSDEDEEESEELFLPSDDDAPSDEDEESPLLLEDASLASFSRARLRVP
jgi:hypothetical protein